MSEIGHNNPTIDISAKDLLELIREVGDMKDTVTEATGKVGARVKEIVKDNEWHKGAFGLIRKIEAMSQTERNDFLRTFDALYEILMENAWRTELDDLLSGIGDEEPEESEEETEEGEESE